MACHQFHQLHVWHSDVHDRPQSVIDRHVHVSRHWMRDAMGVNTTTCTGGALSWHVNGRAGQALSRCRYGEVEGAFANGSLRGDMPLCRREVHRMVDIPLVSSVE